jgi:hypothetical protein
MLAAGETTFYLYKNSTRVNLATIISTNVYT